MSTDEQGRSGVGLDAQRAAIEEEAKRRGWHVVRIAEDVASGKTTNGRHGLASAIASIEAKEAEALVAAKLDRLSRSALDFANLTDGTNRNGWALVVLDLGMDMTTPVGEMIAGVVSYMAQFERRLIGERTKEALAVKKLTGTTSGRPIGHPRQHVPPDIVARIHYERGAGHTQQQIADDLNRDGLLRENGVEWRQAQVGRVLGYEPDPRTWQAWHQPMPVKARYPRCDRCSRRPVARLDGERLCRRHHEQILRQALGGDSTA